MARISRKDSKGIVKKWDDLNELQETFPYTVDGLILFSSMVLEICIPNSPKINRVQIDILKFLCFGGQFIGVEAQRGQAKTTLAAIVCAFLLIHFPASRIVVFSQNSKRAKEIGGFVIKIFYAIEVLEFMLPDQYAGDRSSVESGFDIHWSLRGGDKSPSISSYSIESGAQGARGDIILADDIESLQNSRTAALREWLIEQSLEFESINSTGRIIYLGTPQSVESIYNLLPSRGYNIRIWPGRYPNKEQIEYYGDRLAPMLVDDLSRSPHLAAGYGVDRTLGAPTCPEMFDEENLNGKEMRLGMGKFMLQNMLHTGMSDKDRYRLKLENLVVCNFNTEGGPVMPVWASDPRNHWATAPRFGTRPQDKFFFALHQPYQTRKFDLTVMYIDPAGGGSKSQDEMGYAIGKLLGTYVYLHKVGGVRGGYSEEELMKLVNIAKENQVEIVHIEDNYGKGAHLAMLKPLFEKHYPHCRLEGITESGQKELRIIDTLEPLMGQHRLIVSQTCVMEDYQSIQGYSAEVKMTYSFFFQLGHVTAERGSLRHDDRLDAVSGVVRSLVSFIDYDQSLAEKTREEADAEAWMRAMADPDAFVSVMRNGGDVGEFMSSLVGVNALSKWL